MKLDAHELCWQVHTETSDAQQPFSRCDASRNNQFQAPQWVDSRKRWGSDWAIRFYDERPVDYRQPAPDDCRGELVTGDFRSRGTVCGRSQDRFEVSRIAMDGTVGVVLG